VKVKGYEVCSWTKSHGHVAWYNSGFWVHEICRVVQWMNGRSLEENASRPAECGYSDRTE